MGGNILQREPKQYFSPKYVILAVPGWAFMTVSRYGGGQVMPAVSEFRTALWGRPSHMEVTHVRVLTTAQLRSLLTAASTTRHVSKEASDGFSQPWSTSKHRRHPEWKQPYWAQQNWVTKLRDSNKKCVLFYTMTFV